jgi:hypothetical protein
MGRSLALNDYPTRPTPRPRAEEIAARLADLHARQAADTRTDIQRWLGDPPPDRCALGYCKPHHRRAESEKINWGKFRS